jgi:GntR family transcriptional regulator, transcriptional repressor for pyruvate dehydrogenase complex
MTEPTEVSRRTGAPGRRPEASGPGQRPERPADRAPTDPSQLDGRPRFERIERRSVAGEIRRTLLASIQSGDLGPGAPLPSERDLSEDFGVGRTSVREAIQGLASLGLLEKRGNRSYVIDRLPEVQLAELDPRKVMVTELFEVRRVLELPIARLTACRATARQRREIERLSEGFEPSMPLDEFRRLDRAFHWALARACGNALLADLYGKVLDRLFRSEEFEELLGSEANRDVVADVVRDAVIAHQTIGRAIQTGDGDSVARAAERHLAQVEEQMVARMR